MGVAGVVATVVCYSKEEAMTALMKGAVLAVCTIFFTANVSVSAHAARPGSCSSYHYWNRGNCLDARNKPNPKPWHLQMLAKTWN
jgi:hypothetical protein